MIAPLTPQETFAAVKKWEHWETIQQVAAKEYDLSPAEFDELLPEYQKFLVLAGTSSGGMGMFSNRIDKLWHAHILYLSLYESFCRTYFGRLLYHAPNLQQRSEECTKPDDICVDKDCGNCKTDPGKCTGGECDDECEYSTGHGRATMAHFISAYRRAFGELPAVWDLKKVGA